MFENIALSLLKGLHKSFVLPGRGMLIPYFIVEELCYFDEKFAQYHSDSDFCLRAKKNGYQSFVSWEQIIISYIEKTAIGTSYLRTPFKLFIKGFTNKYSRIYIPDHIRYIFRHGVKPILPLTFIIFLLATFKAHLFNPKIDE